MTSSPPWSPRDYQNLITDRARNRSRSTGVPVDQLIDRYYHRRLLARVFGADPDGWILKGGQALLARWPQARHSRDIDLLRSSPESSVDAAVTALLAAVDTAADDHLHFVHQDTSAERTAGSPTRKVRFTVMFGLRQLATASVDVVAMDFAPCGEVVTEPLTPPFDIDCDPWPDVRMWPLEDHVADKVTAMYERHGASGLPSTRYKDLVDLVLIAIKSPLAGTATHTALHTEVSRRRLLGVRVTLPAVFEIPDRSWRAGYRTQAGQAHDLPAEYRELDTIVPLADALVTPLLQGRPPRGRWCPVTLGWVSGCAV